MELTAEEPAATEPRGRPQLWLVALLVAITAIAVIVVATSGRSGSPATPNLNRPPADAREAATRILDAVVAHKPPPCNEMMQLPRDAGDARVRALEAEYGTPLPFGYSSTVQSQRGLTIMRFRIGPSGSRDFFEVWVSGKTAQPWCTILVGQTKA